MATANETSILKKKISKISESFTVNMYDNGFMVEFSGHDTNDNWSTTKVVCKTTKEVLDIIQEAFNMERN